MGTVYLCKVTDDVSEDLLTISGVSFACIKSRTDLLVHVTDPNRCGDKREVNRCGGE